MLMDDQVLFLQILVKASQSYKAVSFKANWWMRCFQKIFTKSACDYIWYTFWDGNIKIDVNFFGLYQNLSYFLATRYFSRTKLMNIKLILMMIIWFLIYNIFACIKSFGYLWLFSWAYFKEKRSAVTQTDKRTDQSAGLD